MSSDFGEVFIYPTEFFQVVAGLRTRSAAPADLAAIAIPDTCHDGANDSLASLKSAIDDARSALVDNFETAARILTASGANVIEADMDEEGLSDWMLLANPGDATSGRAPTDDVPLYSDVSEFLEGADPSTETD